MTVIHGYLHDIAGTAFDQQGTAIVFSSTLSRPARNDTGLVLRELARIELEDTGGQFETSELDPGPVVVRLEGGVSHGESWYIGIPEEGRWDLATLIGEQVEWTPIVVSRAEAAARASAQSAEESSDHADRSERAADRVGSAERVLQAEATSVAAEQAAGEHRYESKAQADRSESEADRSTAQANASAGSAGDADESAKDAAASEQTAAGHREATAADAEATAVDRVATGEDRVATGESSSAATAAATQSDESAERSEASAVKSQASSDQAAQRIEDAVAETTGITAGHAADAEAAAGRSNASAGKAKASEVAAAESATAAADIALGNIPGATADSRGLVRLGGDLAGTADTPRIPALSLASPGASVQVRPEAVGFGNATAPEASRPTDWEFDGEWLTPPHWLGTVTVTVDWCGRSAALLRGMNTSGAAVTLATIPAGDPDVHRSVTVKVDLSTHGSLAVGGQWIQEDIDAECSAALVVQTIPKHQHTLDEVDGLRSALGSKVEGNDERLSDARTPRAHQHTIRQVEGLRDELDAIHAKILAKGSTHRWDGQGTWTPPDWTGPNDTVINMDTGEFHSVQEVS